MQKMIFKICVKKHFPSFVKIKVAGLPGKVDSGFIKNVKVGKGTAALSRIVYLIDLSHN
ncbi:hypothetical protein MIDIC_460016 [Alphaproteobacteria bacterium]